MTPSAFPPGKPHSGTPDVAAMTDGNPSRPFPLDHPLGRLTPEQIDEVGREFEQLGDAVRAELGAADAHYIRSLVGRAGRGRTSARREPRGGPGIVQ